jgi:hypothetical protein
MKAVEKMVPPIIEKVARERIDRLLQEDGGGFVEIKP